MEAARLLSRHVPTRLWLFHDTDDGEPIHCPRCQQALNRDVNWGTGACEACSIHL